MTAVVEAAMDATTRARSLRALAARRGCRLERAPRWRRGTHVCGGWRLLDNNGHALLGESFDAGLDDVERALVGSVRNA